ncbi:hypothetical protein [Methanoregula sp.]|uniref:hypothetical protein n=1 Tax=Methanoregula sp. TaxID=2052170 RepID=UPI003BAF9685
MNRVFVVLAIILLVTGMGVSLCISKTSPGIQTPVEISPLPTITTLPSPTVPQVTSTPVSSRPLTGTVLAGEIPEEGVGDLILHNNDTSLDAVAVLLVPGLDTPTVSVYIRHGEKYSFASIDDGIYILYLVFGSDWDPGTEHFMTDTHYLRYSDILNFRTFSSTNPENTYFRFSTYEFWISPGMEDANTITPNEFPQRARNS